MAAESKPADIFAFGMLGIEAFTAQLPFTGFADTEVSELIQIGVRPKRPLDSENAGLTNKVWELLRGCWHQDPAQRLGVDEVVEACEESPGDNRWVQKYLSAAKWLV